VERNFDARDLAFRAEAATVLGIQEPATAKKTGR
jgi:hypothetical protein